MAAEDYLASDCYDEEDRQLARMWDFPAFTAEERREYARRKQREEALDLLEDEVTGS